MRRIVLAGLSVVVLVAVVGVAGAGTRAHASLASGPSVTAHRVIGDRRMASPCFVAVATCSIHPCVEFARSAQSAVLLRAQTATVQGQPPRRPAQRCAGPGPNRTLDAVRVGPGVRGYPPDPYAQMLAGALAQAAHRLRDRGR